MMRERQALMAIFRMLSKITHFQAYFDLFLIKIPVPIVSKKDLVRSQGLS